jgi:hypothetical protein
MMSDSNDALARLKSRNRPTVEIRDASLNSISPDISTSGVLESQISGIEEAVTEIQAPVKQELETKQSTLRLEAKVSERLQIMCREQGVCREVLIEALFEYAENNPKALSKVLELAKEKNEHRQQVANKRRAKSMIEKFGG